MPILFVLFNKLLTARIFVYSYIGANKSAKSLNKVNDLEQYTSSFGIAFPQSSRANDNQALHVKTNMPTNSSDPDLIATPDVQQLETIVPGAPVQSRRKSRDVSELSSSRKSRPISGGSFEDNVEIREFASRTDTIFGESDEDTADGLHNGDSLRTDNLEDKLHQHQAQEREKNAFSNGYTQNGEYLNYQDNFSDDTLSILINTKFSSCSSSTLPR